MNPDFVFIINYACPRCRVALESRNSGPPTWLRCPNCGRASEPPEVFRPAVLPGPSGEEILIHERPTPAADLAAGAVAVADPSPLAPRAMAPLPPSEANRAPAGRIVLGSFFFITIFLFLFSLLEADLVKAVIFGAVGASLLFFLARPTGTPLRD